jgi:hypothetical protein
MYGEKLNEGFTLKENFIANEECHLVGYENPVHTSQEIHLRYKAQPVNAM